MKTKFIAVMLLAAASAFAQTHFSFGVGIGAPGYYAPAPYVARPVVPGPGYVWIDGYNDGYGRFVSGYWAQPPYAGGYWVAPRFYGGRYVAGYWGRPGFRGNGYGYGRPFVGGGRFNGRGGGYGHGYRR